MSIQEIESQALSLPAGQRALLAQHLIASLEENETEQAWLDEAERRSNALALGETSAIPAVDVLAEARRSVS